MKFSEWEPIYTEICYDMGYSKLEDEASVRLLESLTLDSNLGDEDDIAPLMKGTASVFGNAPCLEEDIGALPPEGTLIAAGASAGRVLDAGIMPDILVTDLDGDIAPQVRASDGGALTLILAHGDNRALLQRYVSEFRGKVVLTAHGEPRGNVLGFGGFTDGDRSVCLAREFGAERIVLYGFDFENPRPKYGGDPMVKLRKLAWARRIIYSGGGRDVVLPQQI